MRMRETPFHALKGPRRRQVDGARATGAGAGQEAVAAPSETGSNHVLSDIHGDEAGAALSRGHQQQHALAAALLALRPRRPAHRPACARSCCRSCSTTSPGCMPLSAASLSGSTLVTTTPLMTFRRVEGLARFRRQRSQAQAHGVAGGDRHRACACRRRWRPPCLSGRVPMVDLRSGRLALAR